MKSVSENRKSRMAQIIQGLSDCPFLRIEKVQIMIKSVEVKTYYTRHYHLPQRTFKNRLRTN